MIKIPERLWFVTRDPKIDGDDLAYMTNFESNKAFDKKVATGNLWAGHRGSNVDTGKIIDNTPVKNIYIGSSVSRWSTSNKLFRVKDPRGFTVEVPTDNIATLLHHTTVINGVVGEECVWGRDGGNHIILPVNSKPYLDVFKQIDDANEKKKNSIKKESLTVGDVIKLNGNDDGSGYCQYQYYGQFKYVWTVDLVKGGGWRQTIIDTVDITDSKLVHVFLQKYSTGSVYTLELSNSDIITEIIDNQPLFVTDNSQLKVYNAPQRVKNQLKKTDFYKKHANDFDDKKTVYTFKKMVFIK